MQIFIHCKTTLHVSGVVILLVLLLPSNYVPIRPRWRGVAVQVIWPVPEAAGTVLILLMMGAVTPETCRVVLQWINICTLLYLLDFYSRWIKKHGITSLKFNIQLSRIANKSVPYTDTCHNWRSLTACNINKIRQPSFEPSHPLVSKWTVFTSNIKLIFIFVAYNNLGTYGCHIWMPSIHGANRQVRRVSLLSLVNIQWEIAKSKWVEVQVI